MPNAPAVQEISAVSPLRGYSLPLSPTGEAAMITPPPWHFSGEIIMAEYRVDPAAAARFLPADLDPGIDPGAAAAVFAQWQWCSAAGAELSDPGQCQFGEFLLLLGCAYRGRELARCPYAWVDEPVPMMRGWIQGMPKQFGVIHQIRACGVGRAGPRMASGSPFTGVLSVNGMRTARLTVTLTGKAGLPPALHTVPLVHTRYFPAWDPSDRPLSQLVTSEVTAVEFAEVWAGRADFQLITEPGTDLADLAPVAVGSGYVFSYAETLHGGRLLAQDRDGQAAAGADGLGGRPGTAGGAGC